MLVGPDFDQLEKSGPGAKPKTVRIGSGPHSRAPLTGRSLL